MVFWVFSGTWYPEALGFGPRPVPFVEVKLLPTSALEQVGGQFGGLDASALLRLEAAMSQEVGELSLGGLLTRCVDLGEDLDGFRWAWWFWEFRGVGGGAEDWVIWVVWGWSGLVVVGWVLGDAETT